MPRLIFLHVDVQLFQNHLLKSLSFIHYIAFAPLSQISLLYLYGSIPGLSSLFHWLFFLSILTPTSKVLTTVAL